MGCTPCPPPHGMQWGSRDSGGWWGWRGAPPCRVGTGKRRGEAGWAVPQTPGKELAGSQRAAAPRGSPPALCPAGPCRVIPSMAAPHHTAPSPAQRGPSLRGHPLPWRGAQRQVSPRLLPIPSSSAQLPLLPCCPQINPPSRCDAWERLVLHQAQPGHGPFPLQLLEDSRSIPAARSGSRAWRGSRISLHPERWRGEAVQRPKSFWA